MPAGKGRPRGREAEAARNDELILASAREAFREFGASAPVSLIASRAGVGIATLYRRYPSKEDLLREVCASSMRRTIAAAESALADPDAWHGFCDFLVRCLELKVSSLNVLAGTFRVTDEVSMLGDRSRDSIQAVVDRAHVEGPLRPGITAADITKLLQQLNASQSPDLHRSALLARRYLAVILAGLCGSEPLPGEAADWEEGAHQWSRLKESHSGRSD